MPNPLYILQLTDFHIRHIKGGKELSWDSSKEELLFHNFDSYFKSRNKRFFDIVCISGDMVHKNDGGELQNIAIRLIDELKNRRFINEETNIYVVPGNHDIASEKAIENPDLNKARINCLNDSEVPLYQVVDEFVNNKQLLGYYDNYKNFVDKVKAKNLNSTYKGELNYFLGYDEIPLIDNKKIFISWFNTSWLCLRDEHWKKDIFQIDESDRKPELPKIRINDNEKISPGSSINKEIFDRFNIINASKDTIFKLCLTHHETRLLSPHDKVQSKGLNEDCFYNHIRKYSLVLNGHTHSDMFDKPEFTSPGNYEDYNLSFVPILEIDLIRNLIIHNRIPLELMNEPKNFEEREFKISTFNDYEFFEKSYSKFSFVDLMNEMKWNYFDSYKSNPQLYSLNPINRYNCITECNYALEEKSLKLFN
ncbi:MAG: metallophosphoesterase [Saprospiraceae bacterium]|nr:metallophosphoesterase [Saprospiraceae bacterium]